MSTATMFDRNSDRRYSSSRATRLMRDEPSQRLNTKAAGKRDARPRQVAVAFASSERNTRRSTLVAMEGLMAWGMLLVAGIASLCLIGLLASSFYASLAAFSPIDVVRGMGGMN